MHCTKSKRWLVIMDVACLHISVILRIEGLLQENFYHKMTSYRIEKDTKGESMDQSGFGDMTTTPELKPCANFILYSQEPTSYSYESSICSKLDGNVMPLNSDDEEFTNFKEEDTMFKVNTHLFVIFDIILF